MADFFSRRIRGFDEHKEPCCEHCNRVLHTHGEFLVCPCCGEIYRYNVNAYGTSRPHQNGWEGTRMEQNPANPNVWTVIRNHSCRLGNRREDAKYIYYRDANGREVRRVKTPRERQIDREMKFKQGLLWDD